MNHFRTKFSRYCKLALSSQLFDFIGNTGWASTREPDYLHAPLFLHAYSYTPHLRMHKHEIYQIGITVAPLIGCISIEEEEEEEEEPRSRVTPIIN